MRCVFPTHQKFYLPLRSRANILKKGVLDRLLQEVADGCRLAV